MSPNNISLGILAVVLLTVYASLVQSIRESDKKHICARICEWPPRPKTCVYNWSVEWFYAFGDVCSIGCPNSTLPNPHNVKCHEHEDCIVLDGFPRPVAVVNRALPGPSIQVCEGDTIVAHVTNNMHDTKAESTSIHWHGMNHRGTPYMDGVPMITQCPIGYGQRFTYTFPASPAGTHWWHSHTGLQRGDGLFGSLVVRQPSEADPHSKEYDYDLQEHVILINDWYHDLVFLTVSRFLHNDGLLLPKSLLVNGKGDRVDKTGQSSYSDRAIFKVNKGQRYRFRVIHSVVTTCQIRLSIDGHTLRLIAADGNPVQPYDLNSLALNNADRFDFVLNADQKIGNYWLRLTGLACKGLQTLGVIHYRGSPEEDPPENLDTSVTSRILETEMATCPLEIPKKNTSFRLVELNSVGPDDTPKEVDVTHYISTQLINPRSVAPTFQHVIFKEPSSPLLYQWKDVDDNDFCYVENFTNSAEENSFCTNILKVKTNQVVELVFMDESMPERASICHPMHIHGHTFHVIAQGAIKTRITMKEFIELDRKGKIPRKLNSAHKRDTAYLPFQGYLIIRFVADNPGTWFIHCHTEWHLAFGMAMVLQVGEEDEIAPAPPGFPRCGSWPATGSDTSLMGVASSNPNPPSITTSENGTGKMVLLSLVALAFVIALGICIMLIKRRKVGDTDPVRRRLMYYHQDQH